MIAAAEAGGEAGGDGVKAGVVALLSAKAVNHGWALEAVLRGRAPDAA